MTDPQNDTTLTRVLRDTRRIAIVGASLNPARPSHEVAHYLNAAGYVIYPVNPGLAGQTLAGRPIVARLADIADPVDMVDIFRRSEQAGAVVDEALEALPGLRTVWMQIGVRDEAAATRARARGLTVIMDRCPKLEHQRLIAG